MGLSTQKPLAYCVSAHRASPDVAADLDITLRSRRFSGESAWDDTAE
jgi:hypothetical protein